MNKYLPFALLYFFVNAAGLPFGLTYMTLLSPFLYWWTVRERKFEILFPFLMIMFPFMLVHLALNEIDLRKYFLSFLNLTAVYISAQSMYTFFSRSRQTENIIHWVLLVNFILCLASLFFYHSDHSNLFWISQTLTEGVTDFKRLRMFTYEASYYALVFVPVFVFYSLKILLAQNRHNAWMLLPLLIIPFLLSFSLGVLAALLAALVLSFIIQAGWYLRNSRVRNIIFLAGFAIVPMVVLLYYFLPGNSLWLRIENILSWEDSSGRGRTSEAFYLAGQILQQGSEWTGIGPGQLKNMGEELIRDYYLYSPEFTTIAIPNATAETLALFGWAGLGLRIGLQIFLFFYTRVWTNHYRLIMFLFIFIYQFTGSYLTNLAEYVIWILAFTEVFPQFSLGRDGSKITSMNFKHSAWQVS